MHIVDESFILADAKRTVKLALKYVRRQCVEEEFHVIVVDHDLVNVEIYQLTVKLLVARTVHTSRVFVRKFYHHFGYRLRL